MRMSCNGCRVLRKGCSDACTIRPCLQWIDSPEAQANATVFLAKFYGRAGLLNLLAAAAPAPLLGASRPAAPPAAYDIRHVARDPDAVAAADLLRVARGGGRRRFKRAGSSSNACKAKPLKGKASSNERASPSPTQRQHQQETEELELEPVPMVVELEHGEESAGSHDHHHHLQPQGSEEDTDVEAASHVSQ
ncbi:hypothetical protein ACJX0J_029658, partial [Zea mays]